MSLKPGVLATVEPALPTEIMMEDMALYSGAGLAKRPQDFAIPFLAIAQANSPQVKRQQADKFIEGLEPGDVFNTATRKIWKTSQGHGVPVLPVWMEKAWVEWIPREFGGSGGGTGYIATHKIDSGIEKTAQLTTVGKKKLLLLPNKHQIVDTSYHFVIEANELDALVISMWSSALTCSRTWNTLIKGQKIRNKDGHTVIAPSFGRLYSLRTVYRKNDDGDWFTWSVADEGWALPEHKSAYEMARLSFVGFRDHGGPTLGRPPIEESTATGSDDDSPI